MPIRPAAVKGLFYPDNRDELKDLIVGSFSHPLGPGSTLKEGEGEILAGVVPHAGYIYSGPCAAWTFREFPGDGWRGTVVLLGFSHRGYPTELSARDWETPLGILRTDREWLDRVGDRIPIGERGHTGEHSIEVELPFIQFLAEGRGWDVKILSLNVGSDLDPARLAQSLVETEPKDCVYLASSDFTHYGERFGYSPYGDPAQARDKVRQVDLSLAEALCTLSGKDFERIVEDCSPTVCGIHPLRTLMEILKRKTNPVGHIKKYYTSAEISPSREGFVSYASIVFSRNDG